MRKERAMAIVDMFTVGNPKDPGIGPISACLRSLDGRDGLSIQLMLERDRKGYYLPTSMGKTFIDEGYESPEKDPDTSLNWLVVGAMDGKSCLSVDTGSLPRDEAGRAYLAAYRPGKHIRLYFNEA